MSIGSKNPVPNDMRTSIISIYQYEERNPQGIFYNSYYGEAIPFTNLTNLLFLIEDLLEELDCPQASTKDRSFQAVQRTKVRMTVAPSSHTWENQELLATFTLKILFRQNGSWQGKLGWSEKNQEETFRSALELIKMMDNALPQPAALEKSADAAMEDIV